MRNALRALASITVSCVVSATLVICSTPSVALATTSLGTMASAATDEPGFLDWLHGLIFGKHEEEQSTDTTSSTTTTSTSGTTSGSTSTAKDDPFSGPVSSESQAINRVHDLLMRAGKPYLCKFSFVKMTDDGRYLVRGYEDVADGETTHQSTWYLYSVGKDGSIYDEIQLCDIDPTTMEKAGTSSSAGSSYSTDYYTITLPESLSGANISFSGGGSPSGASYVRYIATVVMDNKQLFEVACYTNDARPQGTCAEARIGVPSNDSSYVVYLSTPAWPKSDGGYDYDTAYAKAKEYAAYVTLR